MFNKLWRDFRYNRQRRAVMLLITFVIVAFLYYTLSVKQYTWYVISGKKASDTSNAVCATPEKDMDQLKLLARDIHSVLEGLDLTHVLIYGSLFGALRYQNPVPWDNDIDMLVLDKEIHKLDFNLIKKKFNDKGMDIYYRTWLGTYRVTRGTFARADLMVFRNTYVGDSMCRTGLEPWILFVNHFRFHTFPARLIDRRPLGKLPFAGVNFTVPNEGIEIQKYCYPYDWWKEVKPRGC